MPMEIVLRCALSDRPGALAALAGAVAEAGGDIQSVEVLEHDGGEALDDLVVVIQPDALGNLLDRLAGMPDVELLHAGPSRGHPGDAVSRLAIGFEALLVGTMPPERAIVTLVGGLLRATSAEVCSPVDAPRGGRRTLVVPLDDMVLVVRRDHPFTATERERAATVAQACIRAAAVGQSSLGSSSPG